MASSPWYQCGRVLKSIAPGNRLEKDGVFRYFTSLHLRVFALKTCADALPNHVAMIPGWLNARRDVAVIDLTQRREGREPANDHPETSGCKERPGVSLHRLAPTIYGIPEDGETQVAFSRENSDGINNDNVMLPFFFVCAHSTPSYMLSSHNVGASIIGHHDATKKAPSEKTGLFNLIQLPADECRPRSSRQRPLPSGFVLQPVQHPNRSRRLLEERR